jgi:predicted phage terminase large subunit-like protein
VFDIEVDRTENFIANGLISHNTRWHENDLSGYLVNEHSDKWLHIRLPAIAEGDDLLGRKDGEALCPERFTVEQLGIIKEAMGSQLFAGLYQQRPAPLEGNLIKRDWFRRYTDKPAIFDSVLQSWDMNFKETGSGSFVVGQVWGRARGRFYLLDQIRGRFSFVDTQKHMLAMSQRWPEARDKLVEDAANGPAIISSLCDTLPGIIPIRAKNSKAARLAAISGIIESGNVYLPETTILTDADDLIEETCAFPYAANDDQVDAMTQALDRLYTGGYSFDLSISDAGVRSNPWDFNQ